MSTLVEQLNRLIAELDLRVITLTNMRDAISDDPQMQRLVESFGNFDGSFLPLSTVRSVRRRRKNQTTDLRQVLEYFESVGNDWKLVAEVSENSGVNLNGVYSVLRSGEREGFFEGEPNKGRNRRWRPKSGKNFLKSLFPEAITSPDRSPVLEG